MAGVSKELLSDLPFLQSHLSRSLTEDFKLREDATYFPVLVAAATAGVTSQTLAGAKALNYMVQLWTAGRQVTAALASPSALSAILKTKPNDYSIPGGVQCSDTGDIRILGVPLIPCQFIAGSNIMVGDFANSVAIMRSEDINLRSTEYNGTDFAQNMVSFRLEARDGLALFSTKSFVYGTI